MKRQGKGWRIASGVLLSGLLAFATPTKTPVPGTLNYLEGQATIDGKLLNSTSMGSEVVGPGQILNTQGGGKVEMLLTPGVFLRLGENSEARMVSSGLADLEVALDRGQATVEADYWMKDNRLLIDQNGARTDILKKGLYVLNAEQPYVQVLDGKVELSANDQHISVGKNREAFVDPSGKLKTQDFSKDAVEEAALVRWSKLRSEYEAQANFDAARTVIVNNGWYGPGWYWGPSFGYWSFLPADGILYSPFGWGFYSPFYVYGGPYFYGGYRGYYGRPLYPRTGVVAPRTAIVAPHSFAGGGFAAGGRHR